MTRVHKTGETLPLTPVYTGEQIRAAEQPLLDAGHGPALMRRAAYGLAQRIAGLLKGRLYGAQVTGLIGPGNNGGDGLYALAFLARRGAAARAVLVRQKAHQAGLDEFLTAGGRLVQEVPAGTQALVDAVVGTGFHGEFSAPDVPGLAELLEARDAAGQSPAVVACDLPSGVDADTGAAGDAVLRADHTVTFGGLKQGLLTGHGGLLSGHLHSVDIGLETHLPNTVVRHICGSAPSTGPAASDHKYSRGVVHIVAGSQSYPGAAHLTAGAAISTGTGMVTLQAPDSVRAQVIAACPGVVGIPEQGSQAAAGRAGCVVVGPGIGQEEPDLQRAQAVMEQVLTSGARCVLDASALLLVGDRLRQGRGLAENVLITPHLGEAGKLAAAMRDRLLTRMLKLGSASADPVEAARRIAGKLDCTVLLKGPTTVIASPEGEAILHRAQAPGLATAGTGDVLSGILGALAAGAGPESDWMPVAALGVQRHTAAAQQIDPCGHGHFGASGLIAGLGAGCPA